MQILKRTYFIILFFISTQQYLFSQNDIQISQYMYNKMYFNPAFTGDENYMNASLLMRKQWVGIETAPTTQVFNADMFLERFGGVGLSVINDKLGYEKTINVRLMYAYHKYFRNKSKLSIGIAGGFLNNSLDGSKLIYEDKTVIDPNGLYSVRNAYAPTIDGGIKFSNKRFTLGVSITHAITTIKNATQINEPQHLYLYGNYNININDKIQIIPSVLVKSSVFITTYEFNTNVVFSDKFYGGLSYRNQEAFIVLLGLNITKNLKIRYSYDFNVGPVYKTQSTGSHEIMLSGFLVKNPRKYKSPRYL